MTSHQVYSEQDLLSPQKATQTMNTSTIAYEASPTGIMGFPSDGATSGKPVVLRPGVPTLQSLDHPEEAVEQVERRCASTAKYWADLEHKLVSGVHEFLVPSCDQPFQGFAVSEGHVQHMILKWNMFFQPSMPTLLTPLTPMPGANVLRMVEFFDNFAQRRMQDEAMEPFIAYKTISEKLLGCVSDLEGRCLFHPPTWTFVSPVRHVSSKIQPLVTWWNTEAFKSTSVGTLENTGTHKSPRVVVMANLMQKKLQHLDMEQATHPPSPMDTSEFLVLQMVSALEDLNYKMKSGLYDESPSDEHHVRHLNSLPMVC